MFGCLKPIIAFTSAFLIAASHELNFFLNALTAYSF